MDYACILPAVSDQHVSNIKSTIMYTFVMENHGQKAAHVIKLAQDIPLLSVHVCIKLILISLKLGEDRESLQMRLM